MDTRVLTMLVNQPDTLNGRLEVLHSSLLEKLPELEAISCVIYDASTDLLKPFLSTGQRSFALGGYQLKLAVSPILSQLVENQQCRVIDHVADQVDTESVQVTGLLSQQYQSSFTVPMFHANTFIGFIFFDASKGSIFTEPVQRELILNSQLITMTISAELSLVRSLLATAKAARDFTNLRDFETGLHLERMAHYSRLIARGLIGKYQLNDEYIEHIYLFTSLHDIGKIGVPDKILSKPGRLNTEERAMMQTHVNKGVAILKRVLKDYQLADLRDSEMMLNIVAYHHEYLDGSGYPNGLIGDAIPLEARITTVADIFDALTSRRPYKKAWKVTDAIIELERMQSENKLDKDCVSALKSNVAELERIVVELADEQDQRSVHE